MSLPIIIGSAVVSGITSYLSGESAREDALRRADLITSDLRDSMITAEERRERIDRIGDLYNTNLLGELNSSSIAIAAIGASNPASARSEIAGKILGARSQSILATEMDIDKYNRAIESEIVRVNAGVPSGGDGISDFTIGAAAGTSLGLGISEGIELDESESKLDEIMFGALDKGDDFYTSQKMKSLKDYEIPDLSFESYFR